MSSNYRILMYLLSTLDESIRVAAGLRGAPQLFKRSLIDVNKPSDFLKIKPPEFDSKNIKLPKITVDQLVDDTMLVAEGIRQYTSYVAQNRLKIPEPEKIIPNLNKVSKLANESLSGRKAVIQEPVIIPVNVDGKFDNVDKKKLGQSAETMARLSDKSKERKVPANRVSRVASFGGLALSMGLGAVEEMAKRAIGVSDSKDESMFGSNLLLTKKNAMKIVDTLCQVRGAALKLGQMLSIQDSEILGPELQMIFERVRQSADYMPESQLISVMNSQLGQNWKSLFKNFEMKPFAAASIGQVHRATLPDDSLVAVKVQYPGVAESIESDIKNVLAIVKYANIFPEGLFIDHIMNYAKKELSWEVDYVREAQCQIKYRNLILEYADPEENLKVPIVYEKLSTNRVLTSELISGIPLDKMDDFLETSSMEIKNSVMERLLRLFFRELLLFQYMQTDPNWSNFFYEHTTDTISLIDFGSCRPFSMEFVEKYRKIMMAAIENDREAILWMSEDIGFLSGFENEMFKNAHVDSVLIIGEALRTSEPFDFGRQSVIKRINNQLPVMLRHRLKPPPEEIYSLHRKLSGLFMLCCKLKVQINCREIFDEVNRQIPEVATN